MNTLFVGVVMMIQHGNLYVISGIRLLQQNLKGGTLKKLFRMGTKDTNLALTPCFGITLEWGYCHGVTPECAPSTVAHVIM